MTPQLDLAPAYAEIVRGLLAAHMPDAEVWAYGSRVNGAGHDGSDLDLVLRLPADVRVERSRLGQLKDALEESNLPILVDLLDWAQLPEAFRREIERAHVIVQRPLSAKSAS